MYVQIHTFKATFSYFDHVFSPPAMILVIHTAYLYHSAASRDAIGPSRLPYTVVTYH